MNWLRLLCAGLALALSGCAGWPLQPLEYNPTAPVPSSTPVIETVTPFVVSATSSVVSTESATPTSTIVSPTDTGTPAEATSSPTLAPTPSALPGAVKVDILGCDTSIDVLHGLGEVVNAFVTISNATPSPIPDLCVTLSALHEGRPHPDKTKCLPSLPAGYQVTFKLTVATTFGRSDPIQVDLASSGSLLMRVGDAACKDIDLIQPHVSGLGTPTPIP